MKPNIYEVLAEKAAVTESYLRGIAGFEIEEIEEATTDEEFEDACAQATTHIDILIWQLTRTKNAINRLGRTDFE